MTPLEETESFDQNAVIKVCGIGGGGCNAVNRMIEAGLSGVQFIVINTDAQDLKESNAPVRLQIGKGALGAGAKPEVGRQACEEDRDRVRELLVGGDLIFLALGLGGGTGTGAAPIVAQEAAETGALTIAIVTLPFSFEGEERMSNALKGLAELEKYVDSLIVVPNDRIAELSDASTSFLDAFRHGDEVLHNGVRAISELITVPGLINLDFSDVRTVMEERGRALMGIGIGEGEDRARRAAEEAVVCPLLEQSNINGAKGVIINVRGGTDMRMQEVHEANEFVRRNASPDATIIAGAVVDKDERPEFQVTVIAAGFPKKDASAYLNRNKEAEAQKAAAETLKNKAGIPVELKKKAEQGKGVPVKPAAKAAPSAKTDNGPLFDNMQSDRSNEPKVITPTIDDSDNINIPAFIRRKWEEKKRK